jgi:gamma-glutamyl hydrolase
MQPLVIASFLALLGVGSSLGAPLPPQIRPVIGILSIPIDSSMDDVNYSRIDSSYVRWLESAGALVTPILFNSTAERIEEQFHRLSGVFLTGGMDKPTDYPRYFAAASQLYDLSLKHEMPMWGTCLGFQSIADIIADGADVLSDVEATNMALPLQFSDYAKESRMFRNATPDIMSLFEENSYTTNWHHYGISPETFATMLAPGGMKMISMNVDENNVPFVSTMEHATAPIYATQWHAEANAHDREHDIVDHSWNAVRAMQFLAGFFAQEARTKGLGPGDVGMSECSKCAGNIDLYPLQFIDGSHSLKYIFA